MTASRILVWDLPTRVFHWLLSAGLAATIVFAEFTEEESSWFQAHMILGVVLGLMLVFRIGWGIVGSRYARFGSFLFGPRDLWNYLRGAFTGNDHRFVGHNPGSAYGILVMLFLLGTVVVTGLAMSGGNEAVEELHEIAAYALMAVIVIHIVGVMWYSVRHRENLTLSMFTGSKMGEPNDAISSSRPISALVFVALVVYVTLSLFQNYDQTKHQTRLPFVNTLVTLGE